MKLRKTIAWSVTLLILTAVSIAGIAVYFSRASLQARLDAIRAGGDPVGIADLARTPPSAENNAATYLRDADAEAAAAEKALNLTDPKWDTPGDAEWKKLAAVFAAHPRLLPLLEQASRCPQYVPPRDHGISPTKLQSIIMSDAQEFRKNARLLNLRARLLRKQENAEESLKVSLTMLRLARLLSGEPTMVCHLVAIAVRNVGIKTAAESLSAGAISNALREELDNELATADAPEPFRSALKSERAFSMDMLDEQLSFGGGPWAAWYLALDKSAVLDLYGEQLDAKDHAAAVAAAESHRGGGARPGRRMDSLLAPSLAAFRLAVERDRGLIRSMRIANALQRTGKPDASIDQLQLPAGTTHDPFTGKPMRIRRLDDGWIVYSVGENRTDDGGQIGERTDVGVEVRQKPRGAN